MSLAILLANAARRHADSPAVSVGLQTVLTYGQMGARAAALAGGMMARHGLRPGDRVALALRNCPEYLEILFGCWHAGLVAAPMNAKLHAQELAYMAGDCGARLVVADDDIAAALAPHLPGVPQLVPGSAAYRRLLAGDPLPLYPVDPADAAWLFYTSGTTGKPKGAMLSHRNLMAMAIGYLADVDALDERDGLIHLAATSHASGLFGLSFVAKGANNILPESGGYDGNELAGLIGARARLSFFVPPTLLRRMVADPVLLAAPNQNIRTILLGAAPVFAQDLRAGVQAFGPRLWNGYGQGESPCTITAMSQRDIADALAAGNESRLASVGTARSGTQVIVADDQGQPLPPGATGEVLVRGETVMAGYWNRPEATAETLHKGWLKTGDMGRMDDAGFLWLLDRRKDVIISGGVNIYAREIEDILHDHPGIAEAAVVGQPDPEWGESVVAFVVPSPGATSDPAAWEQMLAERLARFKRPRHWRIVDTLPKNAAGKVLKRQLRADLATQSGDTDQAAWTRK
ncbi:MAG: class I adenylate-forming enzyme family protein [Pararhodobacter sp.]